MHEILFRETIIVVRTLKLFNVLCAAYFGSNAQLLQTSLQLTPCDLTFEWLFNPKLGSKMIRIKVEFVENATGAIR